eukprot:CAMPEP_0172195594 /NCGR_PEP_ID=MMETSP1050-20130122/26304_1 /TAXON_ID=233186 /ORGANISM="Cryptomonas curvata, Strain CCAP979/52" /LENGTH=81 /DNA_ID=CAMNT_0012871693 /DNA_START=194 /DNA_END=436 /DNA_ORIENTATION=+
MISDSTDQPTPEPRNHQSRAPPTVEDWGGSLEQLLRPRDRRPVQRIRAPTDEWPADHRCENAPHSPHSQSRRNCDPRALGF